MTDRVIVGSNKSPSNPTPLSAPQEQQVRDLYYKNVRAKCAAEIESAFDFPFPSSHTRLTTLRSIRPMRPRPHIHHDLRVPRAPARDE